MNKHILFFIAAALIAAAATLTTCKKEKVAVTGVTLDKTTLALVEGQTGKLTATVEGVLNRTHARLKLGNIACYSSVYKQRHI